MKTIEAYKVRFSHKKKKKKKNINLRQNTIELILCSLLRNTTTTKTFFMSLGGIVIRSTTGKV